MTVTVPVMVRYVVARTSDGIIERWGSCAAEDIDYQAGAGQQVFELTDDLIDPQSQRVDLNTSELLDYEPPPPADTVAETWAWNASTRRWVATPTIAALRASAFAAIDLAAGRARLRYITDVPGQQGVYLRKAEQAAAYAAAGFAGPVPPYIQAEAEAIGASAQEAAERVTAIATLWDNQIGPAIEKLRIWGKTAAGIAADAAGVETARTQSIGQLEAL